MSNESMSNATISLQEALLKINNGAPGSPRTPRSRLPSGNESVVVPRVSVKLESLQLPNIPSTPAKTDVLEINAFMVKLEQKGLVRGMGALQKDPLDPRVASKKNKSLANFSCNQMTFNNFGKDNEVFSMCKQLDASAFKPEHVEEFVMALKGSTGYIGSSGSLSGLLTRLTTGMLDAPKVSLRVKDCIRWLERVLEYKPVDVDFVGKSLTEVFAQVSAEVKINFSSSAGVPYYAKIGADGVLEEGVRVASMLLNSIGDGSFNELVSKRRPALMAVLLKNKQDYYKLDRLGDKIRPYFVFPIHERLLYSCLHAHLKAKRFDEDPTGVSGSAVGFSWNYGGGDRLYNWIVDRIERGPGFYPLFYGDDQLWVIVTVSGGAYIVTPDFSHMDLSLSKDVGAIAYKVWKKAYRKLDKTWDSVLRLNCSRAFSCPVIVDAAMTYFFDHGLKSGVPGTTKFDEVMSGAVNGFIQEQYNDAVANIASAEDVEAFVSRISHEVTRIFGLVFKDGSTRLYPFTPGMDSYEWVFLGQSLQVWETSRSLHYVPKPSLEKLLISATTYKKSYRSNAIKQSSTMYKLRSLYAGGGYLYPAFGNRMKAVFESMKLRNVEPFAEGDPDFGMEVENSAFMDIKFQPGDHSWPSYEWCANLFLPPDDQIPEYSGVDVEERTSTSGRVAERESFKPTYDLEAFSSSSDDEDKSEPVEVISKTELGNDISDEELARITEVLNPKSWADQVALERGEEDVGAPPPNPPARAPIERAGQLLPLPQHEKDKFAQDQEALRALERDARALKRAAFEASRVGKAVIRGSSSSMRSGPSRSGADILPGDFDYQEEEQYESDE